MEEDYNGVQMLPLREGAVPPGVARLSVVVGIAALLLGAVT